ncbi:hypothetical protein [Brevundimonas sp. 2YAF1]|uniref:hypothetical protein n=1 Tax=Brevundimonas sp. 2YAF1 TaxID=3233024 RepID=UPI003F9159AD
MNAVPTGNVSDLLSHHDAVRQGVKEGRCHTVSLAPVREALGARWSRHEGLVEDFVLRSFRRGALDDDLILRVNDVDFVLIQPSRSPMSALNRVALLTRLTLGHFLGQVQPDHIRISIIEQAEPGQIEARRVTPAQLEEAARLTVSLADPDEDSPPWEAFGTRQKPRKVVIFKRPEGGELEALYYCEPIWNTAHDAVAVFHLRAQTFHTLPTQRAVVSPDDLTSRAHGLIAHRRLRHASEILSQSSHQNVALSVPLSLDAFAHSSSRIAIMRKLRKIADNEEIGRRLFVELTDLSPNVSVTRVAEAVAQIRGFVRRTTVRLPRHCADYSQWEHTGADGLSVSLDGWATERGARRRLVSLREHARRAGAFAAADGIREPSMAALAHASGLKELSGDLITHAFGDGFEVRPLALEGVLTPRFAA